MAEVVDEGPTYTITHDPEIDAVIHDWEEFTYGEDFRDGCYRLLDVLKETGVQHMIVDTRGIKSHDQEDVEWLETEWVPQVIDETNVQYSTNVVPDSVVAEMEMEELLNKVEGADYTAKMTTDFEEAREWVADQ